MRTVTAKNNLTRVKRNPATREQTSCGYAHQHATIVLRVARCKLRQGQHRRATEATLRLTYWGRLASRRPAVAEQCDSGGRFISLQPAGDANHFPVACSLARLKILPCLAPNFRRTADKVVEWLERSPPIKAIRVRSPTGWLQECCMWAIILAGEFSRGSSIFPSLHSIFASCSLHVILIGSEEIRRFSGKIHDTVFGVLDPIGQGDSRTCFGGFWPRKELDPILGYSVLSYGLKGITAKFRRTGFNPWPGHSEFSQVVIVPNYAADRWVFSGTSHFPRPCIPVLLNFHLIFSLIGSQDIVVKRHPPTSSS
ncbi:hypothetical protein PR048_007571 [Dryococelus australis]|uniref:Uncharacterized protein n=1 Tax=Dryococelus australis TaxID=614101 RepID=A0ABQ9HVH6_9NEOP|nr:hypothetical protein PR048_007571 [Dryococelus australis]